MSTHKGQGQVKGSSFMKQVKRHISELLHGPRYQACEEIPVAKLMTEQMINSHAWCKPLNDPADWRNADDSQHMRPDDPVLGIYRNGQAWALPWWIMKNHHVANLVLEDEPILVTLCEVCSSAGAFLAAPDSQRYTFRLAGMYNGTNLITDLETGSFWNPFKAEVLGDEKCRVRLQRIPLAQCEWQEWLKMHPTTQVVWDKQKQREGHGSSHSPGSPGIGPNMQKTLLRPVDERLPHNTLVLGVEGKANGCAFPLDELNDTGAVLHTQVEGTDTVIFHMPGSMHALAYSPELNGEQLVFKMDEQGLITDTATVSRWNYAGECYAGEHLGSCLDYLNSGLEEWYIWAAYHPDTEIYDPR